jgi:hypothetical protein
MLSFQEPALESARERGKTAGTSTAVEVNKHPNLTASAAKCVGWLQLQPV